MCEEPILITHPEPQDIPVLEQLWIDTFGDPPELIEAFFDRFAPMLTGWIVCRGTKILSSAYLIHGNLFLNKDQMRAAAYVYAVATPEAHRGKGYGGMLMRHFAKMAEDRELLLYTRPANSGLFHWYAGTMQTVPAASVRNCLIAAQKTKAPLVVTPLTAAEYGQARERLLLNRPHILMSEAFLKLQEVYLHAENGGFFSVGDAICACELHKDTLLIKEILTDRDDPETIVQALIYHFRAENAYLNIADEDGEPRLAYLSNSTMQDVAWGLLLD